MVKDRYHILGVGDHPAIQQQIRTLLAVHPTQQFNLSWESNPSHLTDRWAQREIDLLLVVVDSTLANFHQVQKLIPVDQHIPMMVVSSEWDNDVEQAALQAGASDYLSADELSPRLLAHSIRFALHRWETRQMLAHERDLLNTLMESIPDTIYFKDRDSQFTRINKAQARVLGLNSPDEAIGKTDFDFFEHAQEAFDDEQRIIDTGQSVINKQETIRRADGEYRYVTATKVPIRNQAGEITGTVGITRDVTDWVKAERELEVVKEHLEETLTNIQDEMEIARQIQKSLLPDRFPEVRNIRTTAVYIPCSAIGGDLYEVIKLDAHRVGFLVFDVVGHGVPAALIGAMCKIIFLKSIARGFGPKALFEQVNEELFQQFDGQRHVAAFYGVLNTQTLRLTYARAGLPPALLVRTGEQAVRDVVAAGLFIGLFEGQIYEERTIQLQAGDKLLMHTDGLIETFDVNQNLFGMDRLKDVLQTHRDQSISQIMDAILSAQRRYARQDHFDDDVTLLLTEVLSN